MATETVQMLRADAQDNRERILEVARHAFATEGVAVSVRKIARRAGVGTATLYRRFPTKDALLAAAFEEQMGSCSAIVEEATTAEDPWEGFAGLVQGLLERNAPDRSFQRAFAAHVPQAAALAAHREENLRRLLALIRQAKRAGRLREDFEVEDLLLALTAGEGVRGTTPAARQAATRRFAALMVGAFAARHQP